MYLIMSSKGFWNTSDNCWELRPSNATWYYTKGFANIIREIVALDHNIECDIFEIGE